MTTNNEQQRDAFNGWLYLGQKQYEPDDLSEREKDIAILAFDAAIELDRQGRGEPVGWLRNERGEATGKAIFDPLLILGASAPPKGYAATYSPVYPQPTNPVVKESLTVAEPQDSLSLDRLADYIADNWPDKKYSLEEICQRLRATWPTAFMPAEPVKVPSDDDDYARGYMTGQRDAQEAHAEWIAAQPAARAEPTLWIQSNHVTCAQRMGPFMARVSGRKEQSDWLPLYAAPVAAQPDPAMAGDAISDDDIESAVRRVTGDHLGGYTKNDRDFYGELTRELFNLKRVQPASGDDAIYEAGWRNAALWADRGDLMADIGSAAYERDKAIAMQQETRSCE